MEDQQGQTSSRPSSSRVSPLTQNPVLPALPSTLDATQTIFLNHPSLRISSSPASSPGIVEPPPARSGSVYPAMSDTMEKGLEPGPDFFDGASSDSDWEDSEGEVTQTFSEVEGLGSGSLVHSRAGKHHERSRGRSRERSIVTALPLLDRQSAEVAGLGRSTNEKPLLSPTDKQASKRARQVSLQRLNKDNIRVVHNRSSAGTPRDSLKVMGPRVSRSSEAYQNPSHLKASPHLVCPRETATRSITGGILRKAS